MKNKDINKLPCNCKKEFVGESTTKTNDAVVATSNVVRASSSCTCSSMTGPTGPTGPTGITGLSAYDVAVESGFIGTELEWLQSLVGPTGPQIVMGGLIPYSAQDITISFEVFDNQKYYTFGFLTFFSEFSDKSSNGFPTVYSYFEEGGYVENFTTSKQTVLTGLAFEINGQMEIDVGQEVVAKIAVYYSPSKDTNYYLIPESVTTLAPSLTSGPVIASGISDFQFEIPANSKVLVGVMLDLENGALPVEYSEFQGVVWGSLSVKELIS